MRHGGVWTKQDSFHPTEHSGIRSDPECQADNCQRRKTRTAQQLPKTVAQVLSKVFQNISPSGFTTLLFGLRHSTQRKHRGSARLFCRHAFRDVVTDLVIEMFAKLLLHFFIDLMTKKEGAQTPGQRVEPLFDAHV